MKRLVYSFVFVLSVAFLAACGTDSSSGGAPDEVTIGYFPNLDHAAGIVGVEKGFFQDELGDVTAESVHFPNGNDFINALDAGTIDIGYVGPGPAINYYLRGGDIVVLGAAANGATLIVSEKDSGIETLEDFNDMSFGTPGNGCTHNVQLEVMLQDLGLESNRVGGTVEHMSRQAPANAVTLFEQGRMDAYAAPEPWGTYLVEELGANVVAEWDEVFLGETLPSVVLVTSQAFLEENPELVDSILQAHKTSVDFALENTEETLDIINQSIFNLTQTELPETVLENAWERMMVTTETHPEALIDWADASYKLGFIDDEPNLDGFIDTSRLDQIANEE
ncbi:aliphatic sulfonate ABC transporter substrate-binding protein [Desertibacillus haloalkaliphilus]|uniref:aliphatic sulfonate ABC transporter substrate-binding protein n=1 Tax=Desertibacillus haloalkaliphilus TaxID=1328930 RepID=UPI001C26172E|nr:aliphatic sulfonate ABC transporter substrate-binding protein [Desertibacillus haloalkaliphilus]MBU8905475.1 aliphatic sulfonate ABC transporter substrate-binding protein [Desertibacillus haloalkaliphilus]